MVIHHTQATVADAGLVDVVLLRSEDITASDGLGEPMRESSSLVPDGSSLTTELHCARNHKGAVLGYMWTLISITDVTGDGIPEILFHSGYRGVSDSTTYEHILGYNAASNTFTDISREEFYRSGTRVGGRHRSRF